MLMTFNSTEAKLNYCYLYVQITQIYKKKKTIKNYTLWRKQNPVNNWVQKEAEVRNVEEKSDRINPN